MYRDPQQWAYVRRLVLEEGGSRRGVSRKTGLSRKTVRKMLACPQPPARPTPPSGTEENLRGSAQFLASRRHSIDPIAYRRRALYLWGRARDLVMKLDRPQGVSLLRDIAEAINGITVATVMPKSRRSLTGCAETGRNTPGTELKGEAARSWLDCLLRGEMQIASLGDLGPAEQLTVLRGRVQRWNSASTEKSCSHSSEIAGGAASDDRGIPLD